MARLGPYEIHHRIAAGGMAELFLAIEVHPDGTRTPLAIKRIRPEAASDPKLVTMLIDEGRVTEQLAHPGIARTLMTVHEDDQLYLVMEYVDGRDVRSILRALVELGKRLPAGLAALIAMRAVEALDHAHRAVNTDGEPLGIVHRDINPTNLMVSYTGVVRVIDFGIARAADRLTSTQAGVVKGKLRYMAPEQARGRPLDHRADIYSMGLVLYELLAGRRPLAELSDMEFIHRVMRGTLPSITEKNPEVPAELAAVVERAMQVELPHRYADGGEMAKDLDAWLATLPRYPRATDLGSIMTKLFPGEATRMRDELGQQTP